MIKQGTNKPIKISFEIEPRSISVTLHNEIATLKHWGEPDLVTDDRLTFYAPVTQAESSAWEEGPCEIEIRWVDGSGSKEGIVQKRVIREDIERTMDDTVLETELFYFEEEEIIEPLS